MNSTIKTQLFNSNKLPMVANASRIRTEFQQPHSFFDENYFRHGKRFKKSLYEDYRWLPEFTQPLAAAICKFTGITKRDVVLDYGCARGYLVRALIQNGVEAFGLDVSEYAINHSDTLVREKLHHLTNETLPEAIEKLGCLKVDWLIAKDVFEHIDPFVLHETLCDASRLGIKLYVLVPLGDAGRYRIPDYELDASHIIAENEDWWCEFFTSSGYLVEKLRHKVEGIKEAALPLHHKGNCQFVLKPRMADRSVK